MRFSFLIAAIFCLVGCSQGPVRTAYVAQAMAGNYGGTFSLPRAAIAGTVQLAITADGKVTGSLKDSGSGTVESIKGQMSGNGQFVGSSRYPGESLNILKGTFKAAGEKKFEAHLVERRGGSSTSVVLYIQVR